MDIKFSYSDCIFFLWKYFTVTFCKINIPLKTEEDHQKPNLTNLQNCLASLKYEMAILQRKLAPSTTNSPIRTSASEHLSKSHATSVKDDGVSQRYSTKNDDNEDDEERLIVIENI